MSVEEFDKHRQRLKISGAWNQICWCPGIGASYFSVLGTLMLKSGVHRWRFKVLNLDECQHFWRIVIGVVKVNELSDDQRTQLLHEHIGKYQKSYGMVFNSQRPDTAYAIDTTRSGYFGEEYGQVCREKGDMVDMYLDLEHFTLSYAVNGVYHGFAFRNIDAVEYKMIMTLGKRGTQMELVSYETLGEVPFVNVSG